MTTTPAAELGKEAVEVAGPDDDDLTLWSVTTIIGVLDKPALLYWAAEQTANTAIDSTATWQAMADDEGRDAAVKWLRDARFRRPKTRLSDTALGGVTHKMCETYALTGTKPTKDFATQLIVDAGGPQVDIDAELTVVGQCLNQFDDWLHRFQPEYQATEVAVYCPEYGYAGQADAFLTIDGVRFIVDYKAVAIDTPVATPSGWTTMRSLQIGDQVFGRNGRLVTITGKSHTYYHDCYRVQFDDATSIVCDAGHLWAVESTYAPWRRDGEQTITTRELAAHLRNPVTGQRHIIIRTPDPIELPERDLPIDPYVYGCWLGDGTRSSGEITKPDDELFELIAARGYTVGEVGASKYRRTVFGLRRQLRLSGLLGHRDIPTEYERSSLEQRQDLIRGLMDTDGSWNATRQQAVFSSVDKALSETVRSILLTLGERAIVNEAAATGFGVTTTVFQVTWRPMRFVPFTLSRKADSVTLSRGHSWRRLVTAVESTVTVPTQCITVDADDGCFLVGEQMVPTHNSTRNPRNASGYLKKPYPEQVGLQLAGYRNAKYAAVWRPRRFEKFRRRYYLLGPEERELAVPVPEVDTGLVIQITPESCEAYPIRCDEEVHEAFLYALEAFRWVQETSKTVMTDPLLPASGRDIRAADPRTLTEDEHVDLQKRNR